MFRKILANQINSIIATFTIILLMTATAWISIYISYYMVSKPIIVDLVSIEDSFIKETAKQALTETEKQQKVAQFAKVLHSSLEDSARKRNYIVIAKQAVIAGGKDMTADVMQRIKEKMQA